MMASRFCRTGEQLVQELVQGEVQVQPGAQQHSTARLGEMPTVQMCR